MRILCVATKCPWPPHDGGRLVLALTLQSLAAAGHAIAVIAPDDDGVSAPEHVPRNIELHRIGVRPRGWAAALSAARSGSAVTLARHDHVRMRAAVANHTANWKPDIVHAEQLHALANCAPAIAAGVPVVLRMQNVESVLWEQQPRARAAVWLFDLESRRLRAGERLAMEQAAATVALTAADASALAGLARCEDRARILCIEPGFPAEDQPGPAVAGAPALVLAGSAWWPNAQGRRWFLDRVWPLLRTEAPHARLHVFGGRANTQAGVEWHAAPTESQTAYPGNAIAIVPLLAGGGIRMRILEAWSRGIPVIATSVAARGLAAIDGRELLIADTPEHYVHAVRRLHDDAALRAALVGAGREHLVHHHDPLLQAQALVTQYARAIEAAR